MASNQDEGRRQAMLEKQRQEMLADVARQKEALQQASMFPLLRSLCQDLTNLEYRKLKEETNPLQLDLLHELKG